MPNTVTTRRVIRPSTGVEPPPALPSAASAALQPKAPAKLTLWSSWQARLAAMERQSSSTMASDLAKVRAMPRQPDLAEARRLQTTYVDPWTDLQETFEAAVSTTNVHETMLRDYRQFLTIRANLVRTMVKRCLAPSEQNLQQLEASAAEIERFIAARRKS